MFILPINRDAPANKRPNITLVLMALNCLIWLGLTAGGHNQQAIILYGLYSVHWTIHTLFTHMFLHVGILHLAGNMWFLWMFAPKLEERLGSWMFAAAYLLCGLGAATLQILLTPGSTIPMVGASGAISGVAGMYFVLFPRSPFDLVLYVGWWRLKSFDAMTRGAVGTWIGEQFVLGLLTSFSGSAGIAFWAHVGGFLAGLMIGVLIASQTQAEERDALLHPKPFTEEERDKFFADHAEKPSGLTTLNLSGNRTSSMNSIRDEQLSDHL